MKKLLFTLFLFAFFASQKVVAQDYKTALGIRVSPYYGVTLKHFLQEDRALEGILLTRRGGFSLTGLYEVHTPAFKVERLKAFGGIGGHINMYRWGNNGFWKWGDDEDRGIKLGNNSRLAIGIDLILGLEYTFENLPFNLGIDWKPGLNLIGDYGASLDQIAISARFVF